VILDFHHFDEEQDTDPHPHESLKAGYGTALK
jgi:hypothetical protein